MRVPTPNIETAIDAVVASFVGAMTTHRRAWHRKQTEFKTKAKKAETEASKDASLWRSGYYARQVSRTDSCIDRCLTATTRDGDSKQQLTALLAFFDTLNDHSISEDDLSGMAAFELSENLRPLAEKIKTLWHIERAYPGEVRSRAQKIVDEARKLEELQ